MDVHSSEFVLSLHVLQKFRILLLNQINRKRMFLKRKSKLHIRQWFLVQHKAISCQAQIFLILPICFLEVPSVHCLLQFLVPSFRWSISFTSFPRYSAPSTRWHSHILSRVLYILASPPVSQQKLTFLSITYFFLFTDHVSLP